VEEFVGMSKTSKLMLFVVGGLAGLVVLVVVVTALSLRLNAKPRLERLASEAMGMELSIGGRLDIRVVPSLQVALADVHVRNHDADVASAEELDLGIELLPLLRKEVRIKTLALKRVTISIEKDRDGKLNVATPTQARGPLPALNLARVSVSGATVLYADKQSGKELQARDCNLDVRRLQFVFAESSNSLKNLAFAAAFACGEIRTHDLTVSDVTVLVDGKDGFFDLKPLTMRLFGGDGSGSVRADLSGSVPAYQVRYRLTRFRLEEFFKTLSPKSVGEGSMDFSASLSLQGKSTEELKRTVAGEASLHGQNLRLEIGDLDKKFSRYESSQSFNLVDVAAFFFAGPLGLGVTKGYDFARILEGPGGSTMVGTLVSTWQVEHGVAQAKDVALATQENRVALKGGLNFVTGHFDEVTVALIDAKGCPRVLQKIRGPFLSPQVERPSVLRALAGPTRRLFTQARSLLGGQCAVFYAGSVALPR
jgi:uncharacterized protein involved in outer membrane biogenesis